jgi:hypothetical protein
MCSLGGDDYTAIKHDKTGAKSPVTKKRSQRARLRAPITRNTQRMSSYWINGSGPKRKLASSIVRRYKRRRV